MVDADKIFDTRADAEAACERFNEEPPEWGYSPWYLGRAGDGKWWVIRSRCVIAGDLDRDARAYEEAFRAAVERSAMNRDAWRDLEGIEIVEVRLEGSYPQTKLVKLFRAVPSRRISFGQPTADCLFGVRTAIWPAEYTDPEEEAYFHDIYFGEFLGTDPRGYLRLRGGRPCDPDHVNWLR